MIVKKIFSILIWPALLVAFFSCDELPCEDEGGVQANLTFHVIERGSLSDTIIDSLTVIMLTDTLPALEFFYQSKTNNVRFPLSIHSDTTSVVFLYKDSIADTLNFYYDRVMNLPSHACGFTTFFDISEVSTSSNRIDSAWVSKNIVEYGELENVKIYF
ncbi:MAG: hypothetical protein K9G70_12110 [Prolixibacteraceae bacterium]|nr:hypothetical protein [Prolixibacteraceae bacterium]